MKWEMFEASGFKQDKTTVQQLGNLQPELDSLQTNRLGGITTVALPLILRSFNIANSALTQRVELSDFFFEKQRKKTDDWFKERKKERKRRLKRINLSIRSIHGIRRKFIIRLLLSSSPSSASLSLSLFQELIWMANWCKISRIRHKFLESRHQFLMNRVQVASVFFKNISFLLSSSSLAIHFHFSVNLINGRFWPAVVRTDRIWSEKFRCWRDGRPCRAFMEEARHGR